MKITDYAIRNVWWQGKAYINEDRHISSYLARKYRWHSPIPDEIKLAPGNIFTIIHGGSLEILQNGAGRRRY